jgi:hypothetical protein
VASQVGLCSTELAILLTNERAEHESKNKIRIGADTEHTLPYIMSLWKRISRLLTRPLLVAEYRTTMKSVSPVKPISVILTFSVWISSETTTYAVVFSR